jgi:hydrogenase nickel incorporation protein HypB
MEITVLKDILSANDQVAQENRELLDKHDVFVINVMASPGSGKTSVILETIRELQGKVRVGVIEGDISSSIDAETIGKEGIPVIQINTGGECHIGANMLYRALNDLPLSEIDLLFIENVGNLVCTAEFALGEDRKVLIASTPEGDDKPFKYPLMFHTVDAVLINKIDLLPYVKFDADHFTRAVREMNEEIEIIQTSCTSGHGIQEWASWLLAQMGRE